MELATLGLLGYGLLLLAVVADSVFPVVPSEAAILAAAGATTSGTMSLPGVIVSVAAGAVIGDVVVHAVGRTAGRRWTLRLARRRGWSTAAELVRSGGTGGVLIGRFVPLGRTVVAFTTGAAGMRWNRYLPAAFAGALVWAVVMTQLGRSAAAFSGNLVVTIAVGMVAIALIGAGVTLVLRRGTNGRTRSADVSPIRPALVRRAEPGGPVEAWSKIAA